MKRWLRGLFYRPTHHHRTRRFLLAPSLQDLWERGPEVGSMNLADERRARGWLA